MPASSAMRPRSTGRAYRAGGLIATVRNNRILQCARCRDTVARMDLDARMRASGKRMTVQRQMVLEALEHARHHVTAEEIATRIRTKYPQIDPSTVYRNLESLEELGYVR